MLTLLITIITAFMYIADVLSKYIFLAIVIGFAIAEIAAYVLYEKFGLFRVYFHDALGWHTPDDSPQWSDGCSQHARCKHCGRDIMQDSQGNWF